MADIPVTMLITGGGTATALTVVKGMRLVSDVRARAVLGDCSEAIAGRHLADDFALLPRADAADFAARVLAVAQEQGARLVLPLVDFEFAPLAAAARSFEAAGIRLVLPPASAVARCRDKRETVLLFEELGVPYPRTYDVEQARELKAGAYPLFVKPSGGRGSVDAHRAESHAELMRLLHRIDHPIVQRCVEGPGVREVTIDTISDRNGAFVAACPRYRLEIKAGQSYKGVTFASDELTEYCRRICEALSIRGPACIQCFETPDGPRFIEVNPRFGAASILSMVAGLNGVRYLLEESLDLPHAPVTVRPGVQMFRYWEEVFTDCDTGQRIPPTHLE